MPNMVQIIKQAAVEAVEAGKPADILYGTVVSGNPVSVRINQQLTVDGRFLALTRNVTDYEIEMTVAHSTEQAGPGPHTHAYSGRKKFTVQNGLKPGERVILLRTSGGQKYIVLDRVV